MEIKLTESDRELEGILELQRQNHRSEVSETTKQTEGFVTVQHEPDTLQLMNTQARQVVAIHENEVIGYALVMTKELRDHIPVLMPMFDMFEKIDYRGIQLSKHRYYVMGQICIAAAQRGMGIFQALYDKHRAVYQSRFDLCLTEVSSSNPRSMRAHEKVGFNTIHTYTDETDEWNILAWDWKV